MASDTIQYFEMAQPMDIHPDTVAAWQSGRNGEVVALRRVTPGRKYVVEVFPENYYEDKTPIDTLARIHSNKDNALARARKEISRRPA